MTLMVFRGHLIVNAEYLKNYANHAKNYYYRRIEQKTVNGPSDCIIDDDLQQFQ